jgi:ferrous iron transport protein A
MTLAELKPGETGRIVRVGSVGSIRRRIVDMGAVSGTSVTMVKVAPLGDPMEVKIKGYSLTLRKEEAEAIIVEAQSDQEGAR